MPFYKGVEYEKTNGFFECYVCHSEIKRDSGWKEKDGCGYYTLQVGCCSEDCMKLHIMNYVIPDRQRQDAEKAKDKRGREAFDNGVKKVGGAANNKFNEFNDKRAAEKEARKAREAEIEAERKARQERQERLDRIKSREYAIRKAEADNIKSDQDDLFNLFYAGAEEAGFELSGLKDRIYSYFRQDLLETTYHGTGEEDENPTDEDLMQLLEVQAESHLKNAFKYSILCVAGNKSKQIKDKTELCRQVLEDINKLEMLTDRWNNICSKEKKILENTIQYEQLSAKFKNPDGSDDKVKFYEMYITEVNSAGLASYSSAESYLLIESLKEVEPSYQGETEPLIQVLSKKLNNQICEEINRTGTFKLRDCPNLYYTEFNLVSDTLKTSVTHPAQKINYVAVLGKFVEALEKNKSYKFKEAKDTFDKLAASVFLLYVSHATKLKKYSLNPVKIYREFKAYQELKKAVVIEDRWNKINKISPEITARIKDESEKTNIASFKRIISQAVKFTAVAVFAVCMIWYWWLGDTLADSSIDIKNELSGAVAVAKENISDAKDSLNDAKAEKEATNKKAKMQVTSSKNIPADAVSIEGALSQYLSLDSSGVNISVDPKFYDVTLEFTVTANADLEPIFNKQLDSVYGKGHYTYHAANYELDFGEYYKHEADYFAMKDNKEYAVALKDFYEKLLTLKKGESVKYSYTKPNTYFHSKKVTKENKAIGKNWAQNIIEQDKYAINLNARYEITHVDSSGNEVKKDGKTDWQSYSLK